MIERIIAAIFEALCRMVGRSASTPSTARDADRDIGTLRRGGSRIATWLRRQPNGIRPRAESNQDRSSG